MSEARPISSYARRPRIWLWFTAAFVLLIVALLVVAGTLTMSKQSELDAQLAEIARSGMPTTAAELEAFYARPPEQLDATALWLQAIAPLNTAAYQQATKNLPIVGKAGDVPLPGEPWSDLPAAAKLLKGYQGLLAELHQAAAKGGAARYPTNFSLGTGMLLPHAQDLRNAARLLDLEAVVRAHEGDVAGVMQALEAAFAVGRSLENEPLQTSQLIRMACDYLARRRLTGLLPRVKFSDQDLLQLQEQLAQIEYESGLRRALIGERVMGQIELQKLSGPAILLRGGAQPLHLETIRRFLAASQHPWPRALAEAQAIHRGLKADIGNASGLSRSRIMLVAPVAQSLEKSFEVTARNHARNDMAIVALAVQRYLRQHGSLPADLTQLTPELLKSVPFDPFSGRPLHYLVDESGFALYSVGADGIDNNGQGDDTGKPDDVMRILSKPPAAAP